MTHPRRHPARNGQTGFGLVEMMIAITITLFLSVGMLRMLMHVRGSNQSQNGMEQLQEDQRLVLLRLTDTIQHAGYFPTPTSSSTAAELPVASSQSFNAAGQSVTGTSGTGLASDPVVKRSDSVTVRYESASGDGVLDCSGKSNTSGASTILVNTFSMDSAGNLNCTVNGTTQAMAGNVYQLAVLYGVDTDGDGSVNQYMSASSVGSGGYWLSVRAVKVTVTFSNPLAGQPGQSATLPPVSQTIPVLNALT